MEQVSSLNQQNQQHTVRAEDALRTSISSKIKEKISCIASEYFKYCDGIEIFIKGRSADGYSIAISNRTIYFDKKLFSSKEYNQIITQLRSLKQIFASLNQDKKMSNNNQIMNSSEEVVQLLIKSLTGIVISVTTFHQDLKKTRDLQYREQSWYGNQITGHLNEMDQFLRKIILQLKEFLNININRNDCLEIIKLLLDGIAQIRNISSLQSPIIKQAATFFFISYELSTNPNYKTIQQKLSLMLRSTQTFLNPGSLAQYYAQMNENLTCVMENIQKLKANKNSLKLQDSKIVNKISQNVETVNQLFNKIIVSLNPQDTLQPNMIKTQNIHNFLQPFLEKNQHYQNLIISLQSVRNLCHDIQSMKQQTFLMTKFHQLQSNQLQNLQKENKRLERQLLHQKQKSFDVNPMIEKHRQQEEKLREKIRMLEGNLIMKQFDFIDKLKKEQQITTKDPQIIISMNHQLIEKKCKIEVLQKQITRLERENKQMESHLNTLTTTRDDNIKLNSKMEQLSIMIKDLKKQPNQVIEETKIDENHFEKLLQKIETGLKKQKEFKIQFDKAIKNLTKSYENQKKLFEQATANKINELMNNFNLINSNLTNEKIRYREQSLKLSSFLVAIYQEMYKIHQFYHPNNRIEFINYSQVIFDSIRMEHTLDKNQCKDIIIYSKDTIKMLENIIALSKQDQIYASSKIDYYEYKINQLIKKMDDLKDQQNVKSNLHEFFINQQTELRQGQAKDFIYQVEISFNKLITNIANLIEKQQANSENIKNQLVQQNQEIQKRIRLEIKNVETKQKKDYQQSQIKVKKSQINQLLNRISDLSSKLQNQQKLIRQLTAQLGEKDDEIKTIKAQSLKYTLDANQSFKAEKEKLEKEIRQNQKLIEDLKNETENFKKNYFQLESQSKTLQNKLDVQESDQKSAREQVRKLTQQLQNKETELRNMNEQLHKLKQETQKNEITPNGFNAFDLKSGRQNQSNQSNTYSSDSSRQQLKEKQRAFQRLNSNYRELEIQKDKKDKEIYELTRRLNEANSECQRMKIQFIQSNQLIREKQRTFQRLSQKCRELEFQKDKKDNQITTNLNWANYQIELLKNQLKKSNEFVSKVINAFSQKVNRNVSQQQLISEITTYQPPVGMKLIYSSIFLGQDNQRSQTIQLCEQFAGKKIKKTERLGRFPDTNSIVHQVPKITNNFPFIMLYKTAKGTVFGSFSLKLKEPTFFFSFKPDSENKVKKWIPNDIDLKFIPIDFIQGKYIQYGSGELRINCIDLKTISANSDIKGYFNFDWRSITNENDEAKITLSEVELHRIEFE